MECTKEFGRDVKMPHMIGRC